MMKQYNSFLEMAKDRWSVRRFKEDQIKPEELKRILEAGNAAPTACNYQPQLVLVLQSKEAIGKVNQGLGQNMNAPTFLLVCSDTNVSWKNPLGDGADSYETDAVIVATQMMYAAWEQRIGSCWMRGFDSRVISKLFDLPENIRPVALLPLGYPVETAKPSAWHYQKKPLDEMCKIL